MELLLWIILFSMLGGILSVLAAALFLVLPETARQRTLPHLVSFAVGALLGAALLAQLPHAVMHPAAGDPHHIFMAVLIGLLVFFLLEKLVIWRHCHSHGHGHGHDDIEATDPAYTEARGHDKKAAGHLVIIGDGVHNLVDGVLIGASFLVSIELGIITALAVAAHEVPSEVGDFAVLLDSGFSRGAALLWNVVSGLAAPVGAVLAYFTLAGMEQVLPYVLAVAAASFLYIAVADLIPGLHEQPRLNTAWKQLGAILAGVLVIFVAHEAGHAVMEDGHAHGHAEGVNGGHGEPDHAHGTDHAPATDHHHREGP